MTLRSIDMGNTSFHLEPEATLRAMIAEGRWAELRIDYLQRSCTLFDQQLTQRLEQAVDQGRLCSHQVAELIGDGAHLDPVANAA